MKDRAHIFTPDSLEKKFKKLSFGLLPTSYFVPSDNTCVTFKFLKHFNYTNTNTHSHTLIICMTNKPRAHPDVLLYSRHQLPKPLSHFHIHTCRHTHTQTSIDQFLSAHWCPGYWPPVVTSGSQYHCQLGNGYQCHCCRASKTCLHRKTHTFFHPLESCLFQNYKYLKARFVRFGTI